MNKEDGSFKIIGTKPKKNKETVGNEDLDTKPENKEPEPEDVANEDELNTALIHLINKWVSCSKSTKDKKLNDIVSETQMHKHTKKSCLKRGYGCRFNFPRPPSNRTMISRPINELYPEEDNDGQQKIIETAKAVILNVKAALEELEDDCLDYDDNLEKFLKEKCDPELDINTYHDYLKISVSGGYTVILQRKVSERNVNNYHPNFQKVWNGNTDIQICLDSFAVITYITDYLTKGERGLTRLLKEALKEKRGAEKFDLMNHLKKTYFFNTQTCVCDAAYKLIPGLDLKGSTTKCLFVASGFKDQRYMYLHQLPDDDHHEHKNDDDDPSKDFPQEKESSRFTKVKNMDGKNYLVPESKHDKYEQRPEDSECKVCPGAFEKMCFAKFNILYEYNNQTTPNICWHPIVLNRSGIHDCRNSVDDIQKLFKPKSAKSKNKNKTNNDEQDEETEDETKETDDENLENESSSQNNNAKQSHGLTSKRITLPGWRWGDKKNEVTDKSTFEPEVGYTRHNYNLIKEKIECHEFMKIYEYSEDDSEINPVLIGYLPQWIKLSNGRTMKLRTKPYVLRMYSYPKDIVQKKYSELLLFTAWRREDNFRQADNSNEDESNQKCNADNDNIDQEASNKKELLSFDDPVFELKIEKLSNEKKKEWEYNRNKIYPFSRKMDEVKKLMESENFQRSTTLYDSINPQAQQENLENADELEASDEDDDFPEEPESENPTKRNRKPKQNMETSFVPEKCIFKKTFIPEDTNELFRSVRELSFEQRVVFDKFIHYFKSMKCVRNGGDIMPEPPRIIVHGKYLLIFTF